MESGVSPTELKRLDGAFLHRTALRPSVEPNPPIVTTSQDITALKSFLLGAGLIESDEEIETRPLLGGVSSDIHLVRAPRGLFVVKRALAQLRVEGEWFAPVVRSSHEAAYLRVAQQLLPGLCPDLLDHDPETGYIAMQYLEPDDYALWKTQLLDGRVDIEVAGNVGGSLGRFHAAAAANPDLADEFETTAEFKSLRLDPYFETLPAKHPQVATRISELVAMLLANRRTLVHGDVSPKNILVADDSSVVFLDAECAWWGDPAFDLAFCLNHLVLKTFMGSDSIRALAASAEALADRYFAHVDWEDPGDLAKRAAALLPALMLARVDGLSPVEYFDDEQKSAVRVFALDLLTGDDEPSLDSVVSSRLESAE